MKQKLKQFHANLPYFRLLQKFYTNINNKIHSSHKYQKQ